MAVADDDVERARPAASAMKLPFSGTRKHETASSRQQQEIEHGQPDVGELLAEQELRAG